MKQNDVKIDYNKCIGCGICEKVCVLNNIKLNNKKASLICNNCIKCGQCLAVCPNNAISICGYESRQIEKKENINLNPDDILNVIRFRRSIRQFKQKNISMEIINQILEAGRLTHTAKNIQDVSFVVLNKKKKYVEKIAVKIFKRVKPLVNIFSKTARKIKINDNFFFFDAPLVIIIMAKNKDNGILAAQNMEFVAEANGLGVLYSGFFTMAVRFSRKIKKLIGVSKGKKVAMTLVLGYPNVKYFRSAPRKELDVKYM